MSSTLASRLVLTLLAAAGGLGAQTCTFTLSVDQQSFPLAGGSGTLTIKASSSTCARSVTSTVSWIVIVFGQTGTGNGSAGFTVAANNDAPTRTGMITVGSQSITITQAGPPCNFATNPSSVNIPSSGQNGSFSLSGLAGCTWTASTIASWLQVSPASGMGPSTISYTAQANTGSTSRSGIISIAGLNFTVNQAAVCAYTLAPTNGSYGSSGGTGTFAISSTAGCPWTATASASWIHITSASSGSGPGQVTFALDANTGDARTANITVGGQTFTVAQASLACSFTLSPSTATIPATGGTGTFSVSGPSSCGWTASTTSNWLTIVSATAGSGNGVIGFSAAANSGDARTGTITVGGQAFTVMQPGAGIQISANSIANAASYTGGGVSPGLIVTLAVPGVGPADVVSTQLTADGNFFATLLGGTRILFDGVAAPMVYAANGQFGAIVPYDVAAHPTTQLQIEYQGQRSNSVTLPVVPSQPGLFSLDASGSGPGAILDPQFHLNSADNPAPRGSVVLLYATGEGQTSDPGIDGKLATVPLPKPILPVTVTIDGLPAEVLYSGAAPGLVAGVMQVNVRIPDGAASGARPVVLQVGQFQSQTGVTVAVQ